MKTGKRCILIVTLGLLSGLLAFAGCGEEPAAQGHEEHVYEWTVTREATCREEGEEKGVCECGDETTRAIPRTAHQLDESTLQVTTEPTCYSKGAGTEACKVCGSEQPVEIPMVPHDLSFHEGYPATCAEDGQIDYWECGICGRYFVDAEGKQDAASLVISKESIEHHYVDGICTVCKQQQPGAEHRCVPVKVDGVEPTCKEYGTKEHYRCETCGKLYLDADAKQLVSEDDITLQPSNDHKGELNAEYHTAVPSPDCLTYGIKEHWDCKVCGKHFASGDLDPEKELIDIEELGETEVSENTLQDPKSDRHVMEKHEAGAATCVSQGFEKTCFVCKLCSLTYLEEDYFEVFDKPNEGATPVELSELISEIDPENHVNKEGAIFHEKEEASRCGRSSWAIGYKEDCYECPDCHKLFHKEDLTDPFDSNEEAIAYKAHEGEIQEVEEVNSTCREKGHRAAWRCTSCNEYFDTPNPTAETLPLAEVDYWYPLAPHTLELLKSDSRGHWYACSVPWCDGVELNDDGTQKIEPHIYDGDDLSQCTYCNYGNVDFTEFFVIKDNTKTQTAKITGLQKGSDGNYEILNTSETVLRIPAYSKTNLPITEIGDNALSTTEPGTRSKMKAVFQQVKTIIVPNTITKIGESAFSELYTFGGSDDDGTTRTKLVQSVIFEEGENPVTIGKQAFAGMRSLTELVLPKYVTGFPEYMAWGCYNLEKLTMPKEVRPLEGQDTFSLTSTFQECYKLKSVDFFCLKDYNYTMRETFRGMTALEEVFLPKNITLLDTHTFYRCIAIKKIHYGGTNTDWDNIKKNEALGTNISWRLNVATLSEEYRGEWLDAGYTPNN